MSVSQAEAAGTGQDRLAVATVSKTFGSARVLREIGLRIAPGELHGLVGQNGCGKSTLVKILTGIYPPRPRRCHHGGRQGAHAAGPPP